MKEFRPGEDPGPADGMGMPPEIDHKRVVQDVNATNPGQQKPKTLDELLRLLEEVQG